MRPLLATVCADSRFVGANRVAIGDSAMIPDRSKPGVAFWATVVVVVALVYVVSIGPAAWTVGTLGHPPWALHVYWWIYAPLHRRYEISPESVRQASDWYCGLFGAT